VDNRFAASLETAAWFVIAEAVANAVKHAGVDEVTINVSATDSALRVVVVDAGSGGADPRGSGLQGLGDRVAALRGSLAVHEVMPHGTSVEAEFPCVS
jgi:signal transduction histidine kinase